MLKHSFCQHWIIYLFLLSHQNVKACFLGYLWKSNCDKVKKYLLIISTGLKIVFCVCFAQFWLAYIHNNVINISLGETTLYWNNKVSNFYYIMLLTVIFSLLLFFHIFLQSSISFKNKILHWKLCSNTQFKIVNIW